MDLANKKILVTGGAGFIGSHMVDRLITKGVNVFIIDNLSTGREENLNSKAKFYKLNIADSKIEDIFQKEKPEIIYHFAFNVLVPKSVKNPLVDMDSIAGSLKILQNAKKYGVKKIIFPSSGFIYGNNPNLPVKETEPFEPVSPYAVAKYTVENYLRFFNKTYQLPYVIFRYAGVYGPRQVTGAMADYIRKLSSNRQAEMYGDGEKTRDFVYIDDVINTNLLALKIPDNYPNPVFNIATSIETTLNEVYQKIAKLLNKPAQPIYLPNRPGEQVRYSLDYSKIKKEFGWQPKVNLEEGLKLVLESWKLI